MSSTLHQPVLASFSTRDSAPGLDLEIWYLEGVIEPGGPIGRHQIGQSVFRVGRDRSADLPLPSRMVSKRHAEIVATGSTMFVRDRGSTNGTFVNGRRLRPEEPSPIGTADLLQFADIEFRVGRLEQDDAAATYIESQPEKGWLISGMTELVEEERLRMVYQPIVDIDTAMMIGAEALVRSDVRGLENPATIFATAAQLGWSERVSDLCRTVAVETIHRCNATPGLLFLNTDPSEQLDEVLLTSMRRLRRLAGTLPIILELHEGAVPDLDTIREFKAALNDLDIGIAYDDFGAGQSRLLELARVPPDYLKFDRSLVQDVDEASHGQRMLLGTLVSTMREAGVTVLAEGLEREGEVEVCRELGFELAQGYFFGRPVPLEELPAA